MNNEKVVDLLKKMKSRREDDRNMAYHAQEYKKAEIIFAEIKEIDEAIEFLGGAEYDDGQGRKYDILDEEIN